MPPKQGRFYVHGSSPKTIFTNEEDSAVLVQFWQTPTNEDGSFTNTTTYFAFTRDDCTIDKGTPMPAGGTILRVILAPSETIYGVSDDQGRGGWIAQPVAVR